MKVHSFELDSEKHSLVVDNEELNSIGVETKSKQQQIVGILLCKFCWVSGGDNFYTSA